MNYGNVMGGGLVLASGTTALAVGSSPADLGLILVSTIAAAVGSGLIYRFATRGKRIGAADTP